MEIIPLHSLVLCDSVERLLTFASHEVVDLAAISHQLVGGTRRHDLLPIVYGELRHRVALKLSLGERTVIDTRGLTHEQRRQLTTIASNQGAAIYSLGQKLGSGCHQLSTSAKITLVQALPTNTDDYLRSQNWQGITVIGDVHGDVASLEQALTWARSRRHFVWLLGDVIDYGAQTLAALDAAHRAVMCGEAAMVLANHERKIARWLDRDDHHVRLSEGNRVTTNALDHLPSRERTAWIGRFRALLSHTSLMQQIGNVTLMHAAAHPSLWEQPDPAAIEQYALFGESEQNGGQYKRTHRWIDAVPQGKTVIVGHNIMSNYPFISTGSKGGKVVFLDTGSGKGGPLSSADLRFGADGDLHLECFNRY